ncbi:MAG: SAM-dependent DNA methyltransferase [Methanomassiliicoccales archaeon]|nr:MAG: SAM-dependent DNA methyltransferase [Methanomassiliicoccales archaeon]
MVGTHEDTVNGLLADYLRDNGLSITTHPIAKRPRRRTPDFELRDGAILFGEGEWNSSYVRGYDQAIEFGDIPGASGYFLIGYPDELKERVRQKRIDTASPTVLLGGVTYRGMFKIKGEPTSLFRGALEEIPEWLRQSLARQPRPPDTREFVELMRDIVRGLTYLLPTRGKFPLLFEHIIAPMPHDKGELETARRAAAYLLLNQVVFYRILQERGYSVIEPGKLEQPSDLKEYFDRVLKDDYQAIFDFDVASLFPQDGIHYIRDMVEIVNELQPEQFTRDLLGNMFHSLIPLEVRKPVAAYYTNPMAARLLSKLSIESESDSVADFACGSGTLLMAAYERKSELLGHAVDEETHRKFVEEDLTGIDIMPFAAHLAVVQLALRNPGYLTDRVRVAVYDSTTLKPGSEIRPLQRVMPRGQASIHHFGEEEMERRKVREGAVSGAGAGRGFRLQPVDVVIMNPPFTRKQHLKKDFRALLTNRFKDYSDYASKEQNLFGYFILLSDRFLANNGRVALVLPVSFLRQLSSQGVRNLISSEYQIEFIVQSGFRLAFSEDTAFPEILLIARKVGAESAKGPCVLARLDVMPSERNVDALADLLRDAIKEEIIDRTFEHRASKIGVSISRIEQDVLQESVNWQRLLPGERIQGYHMPDSPLIAPLSEVAPNVIQGLRFHRDSDKLSTKNSLLTRPRDVAVRMNWEVREEDKKTVEARSRTSGEVVKVPRSALLPTTRSASGMPSMEISTAFDYLVVGRFPNDEVFWDDPDPDGVIERRVKHIESRESYLISPGRNNVGLSSGGTHLLAFVSPQRIAPTWSFWSIQMETVKEARLLCLWWNSTLHLAQLIEGRAETGGAWVCWLKNDLLQMRVLNPHALSSETKKDLLGIYEAWKDKTFPSLLDQLRTRFEGRLAIDSALAKALGMSLEELGLPDLYNTLAARIESMDKTASRE